jgi:hypothetical protein
MTDDRKIKGPADQEKINVNQPYEVEYWTKSLGVTKEDLIDAVRVVGTNTIAVKAELIMRGKLVNKKP